MSCLKPVTGSPSGEFWAWTSGFSARNEYMEATMTPATCLVEGNQVVLAWMFFYPIVAVLASLTWSCLFEGKFLCHSGNYFSLLVCFYFYFIFFFLKNTIWSDPEMRLFCGLS